MPPKRFLPLERNKGPDQGGKYQYVVDKLLKGLDRCPETIYSLSAKSTLLILPESSAQCVKTQNRQERAKERRKRTHQADTALRGPQQTLEESRVRAEPTTLSTWRSPLLCSVLH